MLELDAATLRSLAVKASCDERTIQKAARGEAIRGMAGYRAREALKAAGFTVPLTPSPNVADAKSEGSR